MPASPLSTVARSAGGVRAADVWELTKPGITFMVVVTTAFGFLLASPGRLDVVLLLHTLVATALVSGGASCLNHVLERDIDALMRRTRNRPLPAGRLHADVALLLGVTLGLVGLVYLDVGVNPVAALLGVIALVGYVLVYTPMKRVSSLATLVGAIPGALPPMMGWAAVRGQLEPASWALFALLGLWQLPHFLSIAWLCREDYRRAGLPMLSVLDPSGARSGRQALLYCAALVPVSLLPGLLGLVGRVYLVGALLLGLGFLVACGRFAAVRSTRTARWLMLTSVLYLPAIFLVMLVDRAL